MNNQMTSSLLSSQPEVVLSKIERCMQSATNAWQVKTTQAFLSLYYRQYGNPLPEREQVIHAQLINLREELHVD